MKKSLAAVVFTAAALVMPAAAHAADAAPVTCDGELSNQVVGDVTVRFETSCRLTNVLVLGDLTARTDAGDIVLERSAITGNVRTAFGDAFTLSRSTVGGTISLSEPQGDVTVTRSVIGDDTTIFGAAGAIRLGDAAASQLGSVFAGAVVIDSSFGPGSVHRNAIKDGLRIANGFAPFSITSNIVGGALDCDGNDPAPSGSRNAAAQKLGQCAGL